VYFNRNREHLTYVKNRHFTELILLVLLYIFCAVQKFSDQKMGRDSGIMKFSGTLPEHSHGGSGTVFVPYRAEATTRRVKSAPPSG
jgi:hypothetical protein